MDSVVGVSLRPSTMWEHGWSHHDALVFLGIPKSLRKKSSIHHVYMFVHMLCWAISLFSELEVSPTLPFSHEWPSPTNNTTFIGRSTSFSRVCDLRLLLCGRVPFARCPVCPWRLASDRPTRKPQVLRCDSEELGKPLFVGGGLVTVLPSLRISDVIHNL